MRQFVGLILAPDAQVDLTQKIDEMDLSGLPDWHAFVLGQVANARMWRDYDGDGREFDTEDDDE